MNFLRRLFAVFGRREVAGEQRFDQAEFDHARTLAAKPDFQGAAAVLARLAARFPTRIDVLRQWHAVAKYEPAGEHYHGAVGLILALPNPDRPTRQYQRQVFTEYCDRARPAPRLSPALLGRIGIAMARTGHLSEAERAAEALLRAAPDDPQLAPLWACLAEGHAKIAGSASSIKRAKHYRALIGARAKARGER